MFLRDMGIEKGDRVCIYLPMIPELAVTMLACANWELFILLFLQDSQASAVASRVNDCETKMVITSDGSYRGNKVLDLKSIVDDALEKRRPWRKFLL